MIFLVAILAFGITFAGGLLALRFRDQLHLILGFSAGAVIGVVFFDLLPEALELSRQYWDAGTVLTLTATGFLLYLLLDRLTILHRHDGADCHNTHHHHRGALGAGSLSIHSFFDGLAVGFAFQVSGAVGLIVTVAVLVHDFSDGVNTVGLIVKSGGDRRAATRWLLADALAPALGILATFFIELPEIVLGPILALFAGFFLYIGAGELLPESHHAHPTRLTTVMTIAGVIVMYLAIQLAG